MRWTYETLQEKFPVGTEVCILDVGDESLTHTHYTSNDEMRIMKGGVVDDLDMYGTLPKVRVKHSNGHAWTYHPADLMPVIPEEPKDTKLWAICIDADELAKMGQAGYKVEQVKRKIMNGVSYKDYELKKYNRYIGRLEDGRKWGLDEEKVHLIHDCDWLHAKDLVYTLDKRKKDLTPTQLEKDMEDALAFHRLERLLQDE